MSARRVVDNTARLFVRNLLDWFRAAEVAGWSAAGADITCRLPCCGGESLARYLDEDLDASWHSMHAFADLLATSSTPIRRTDRPEFRNACISAIARCPELTISAIR
jgi:hypothetical protein